MHPRSLSDIQTASAHPAPIPERVDYLEKLLGDSANKHWKESQAPKAAHAECDAAHRSMSKDLEGLKGLPSTTPPLRSACSTWSRRSATPPTSARGSCPA